MNSQIKNRKVETMSIDKFRRKLGSSKPWKFVGRTNKYNVAPREKRTWRGIWNGEEKTIVFDSKAEMVRFCELLILEKNGEIKKLEIQKKYELVAGIKYVADFVYNEDGKIVVEDTKGVRTAVYRIKKKLLLHFYKTIDFREV